LDELIAAVSNAYSELEPHNLNKTFLTLQSVMLSCMDDEGGNRFRIPHLGKENLVNTGQLPVSITCPLETVTRARDAIADVNLANLFSHLSLK
jgi:hypothetical protein